MGAGRRKEVGGGIHNLDTSSSKLPCLYQCKRLTFLSETDSQGVGFAGDHPDLNIFFQPTKWMDG